MDEKQFQELLKKVQEARKSAGVDLATDEDLSIAVMNLISLEEHFFFTGEKTGKPEYFDLLNEVRQSRKALLAKLVPKDQHEGETWCITKHLLAASMRCMEVGTKLEQDGKKELAKELFDHSYRMYSLFWGLRLKLISVAGIKETAAKDKPWGLQDIVDKLVDCCDE